MTIKWFLYAREKKEGKKWRALNWRDGRQCQNLIHATLFTEIEAQKALKEAQELNSDIFDFALKKTNTEQRIIKRRSK